MTAPNIESSTREERLNYVLNEWKCLHNCEPMEQREQKPNLFGLCRVATEEDEVKFAANATFSKAGTRRRSMPNTLTGNGRTWTSPWKSETANSS